MIYIKSFKNYEEFKEIFAVVEHGNGVKSRKNKILLAALKDKNLRKWWMHFVESCSIAKYSTFPYIDLFHVKDMDGLERFANFCMREVFWRYKLNLDSRGTAAHLITLANAFSCYSTDITVDGLGGLCEDGDTKSIRYKNAEGRVYKMKAGKFLRRCIDSTFLKDVFPEQIKVWICEEFAREWQSYAESKLSTDKYELHVDYNFEDIYNSEKCVGDFKSCMTDKDQYSFYEDSIDCHAAYLTDKDGKIVARCILYDHVEDDNGNVYRLAERQYATDGSDILKQILVDKLIAAGEIDGYKRVGVDCHDNMNFLLNDGTSMRDTCLHIKNRLDNEDILSYQDSFIYFDACRNIAYNSSRHDYSHLLDTTDNYFDAGNYSNYLECYIPEDESIYDEYFEDYTTKDRFVDAIYHGDVIHVDEERVRESEYFVYSKWKEIWIHYDEAVWDEYYDDYTTDDDFCTVYSDGEITASESRVSEDSDFVYSDEYQMYLHHDDAILIASHHDYYLTKDCVWLDYIDDNALESECVEDIDGEMRLESDCTYSDELEAWLLIDNAEYDENLQSWMPKHELVKA